MTLKDSPVVVQPDITISGHLLSIIVKDESSNPLKAAKVTLLSSKKLEIENAYKKNELEVSKTSSGKHLYSLEADSKGTVRFSCLPPGEYSITPSLKTEGTEFSFDPKEQLFTMGSQNAEVNFIAIFYIR